MAHAGPSLVVISQLLERLLMMLITDPDPAIRFELCHGLGPQFDALLASESNLQLLFSGLHDENHGVREAILALVGRLAPRNPALIMPVLRRALVHVLAELQHAEVQVGPLGRFFSHPKTFYYVFCPRFLHPRKL